LHVQIRSEADLTALLDGLVEAEVPGRRGLDAWQAFIHSHATLMRRLGADLQEKTGLGLGDFDVLAQLALAGGELRMTELAARAFISRSAMTRRIVRLVDERLVRRSGDDADARGVVIGLTKAGVARLTDAVSVHMRGVSELFLGRLDDEELAVLRRALDKVTLDTTFG
jgi:DNA-binding MarR family transcriptional regulator